MPGRVKIQGRSFKFVDIHGRVWEFDEYGSDITSLGPTDPGSLSVQGDYLVFVTAGGQRRRIKSDQIVTYNSPDPPGTIRIKGHGELLYTTKNGRQHRAHYDNSYYDGGYYDWGGHTDSAHTDNHHDDQDIGYDDLVYIDTIHNDHDDSRFNPHNDIPHTDEGYIDREPYYYDDSQPYPSSW